MTADATAAPWYDIHPLANLFPEMTGDEYDALREDIRAHGLHEPIWLYQDQILDGKHRARACSDLGIDPAVRMWPGDAPRAFVISLNLHRRQLTIGQRAAIADKLATMGRGRPKKMVGSDHLSGDKLNGRI